MPKNINYLQIYSKYLFGKLKIQNPIRLGTQLMSHMLWGMTLKNLILAALRYTTITINVFIRNN